MIIEKVFKLLFSTYHYPFGSSDERIGRMKEAERTEYFRQARDLVENRVFIQEMEDLIRRYYQELACKSVSTVEQNAYRLTLKALQDFDKRVRNLGNMYRAPNVNKSLNSSI